MLKLIMQIWHRVCIVKERLGLEEKFCITHLKFYLDIDKVWRTSPH